MNRRAVFALSCVLVASVGAGLVWQWSGGKPQLGDEGKPLSSGPVRSRTGLKPALPAPKFESPATTSPSPDEPLPNPLLARVFKDGGTVLKGEQLADYLALNKRNAESLVTASRLTGDLALLREAVAKYPSDASAQFELAMRTMDEAEREHALEALRAADPDNSLGSYLAAAQAFKSGRADDAVRLLTDASAQGKLDDYLMANVIAAEEAYASAGFSPLESKAAAMFGASMPQVQEFQSLSREMDSLRKAYLEVGDTASAQAILEMGMDLGQRTQQALGGKILINDLVGQAIEQRFLKTLDPNTVIDGTGLTAQQRMDQLAARKDLIKRTIQGADPTAANIDPQVLTQFLDRQKALGEMAALQWLRGRLGIESK